MSKVKQNSSQAESTDLLAREKQISEVHIYKGVKFGGQVVTYVSLDSAFSDKTLAKGNLATLMEHGVRLTNEKTKEEVIVPFNNISFYRLV
jgi:hypothetical protein